MGQTNSDPDQNTYFAAHLLRGPGHRPAECPGELEEQDGQSLSRQQSSLVPSMAQRYFLGPQCRLDTGRYLHASAAGNSSILMTAPVPSSIEKADLAWRSQDQSSFHLSCLEEKTRKALQAIQPLRAFLAFLVGF